MTPGEADVHEGPPFRPLRLAYELNSCLVRKAVALPCIARYARADDVFPSRLAATISRKDMIKVQFAALKNLPAILTRVPVALEDVVPCKFHFLLRQSLEKQKHDDPWHANAHRNCANHFRFGIRPRKIPPARKIVRQIVVRSVGRNHLSMPLIKERESSARRTCVHRLPQAVEHKNGLV